MQYVNRTSVKIPIIVSIRHKVMTLQQIFITNLKKLRKERGISQMKLSEMCDTTSNYIGQIEMGRRIPSFDKIEKIAAALGLHSCKLFLYDAEEKKVDTKTKDYLLKMPIKVRKEIISNLLTGIKNNVNTAFDINNY